MFHPTAGTCSDWPTVSNWPVVNGRNSEPLEWRDGRVVPRHHVHRDCVRPPPLSDSVVIARVVVWRLIYIGPRVSPGMCVGGGPVGVGRSKLDYTIRRSPRARHVWLRFTGSGGLVVVVPQRFDVRRVPAVVAANSEWIERAAHRMAKRRQETFQAEPCALPDRIRLDSEGREWTVRYRITSSQRVTVVAHPGDVLDVRGATSDADACRRALVRWLYRVAKARFIVRVHEIATEAGFTVGRIAIRSQSTRWASCSRSATISLNIRLLFAAPELVRHVVLHELCHTMRMDHSDAFWSLLEKHDSDWRAHRSRLRAAWRDVPGWVTTRSG